MRLLYLLPALLLSGCAVDPSRYGEMTETGGVTSFPMGNDTFKIEARGNGVTSPQTVNNFALLRAAELAQSVGATHFVVLDEANRDSVTTGSLGATATTRLTGNMAHTTVRDNTYSIPKSGRDMMVRVYRSDPPPGALLAADIVAQIGPLVR